ncbi:hypothetical protein IWX47DRAFT_844166 [Phyllosticta citricarpa]
MPCRDTSHRHNQFIWLCSGDFSICDCERLCDFCKEDKERKFDWRSASKLVQHVQQVHGPFGTLQDVPFISIDKPTDDEDELNKYIRICHCNSDRDFPLEKHLIPRKSDVQEEEHVEKAPALDYLQRGYSPPTGLDHRASKRRKITEEEDKENDASGKLTASRKEEELPIDHSQRKDLSIRRRSPRKKKDKVQEDVGRRTSTSQEKDREVVDLTVDDFEWVDHPVSPKQPQNTGDEDEDCFVIVESVEKDDDLTICSPKRRASGSRPRPRNKSISPRRVPQGAGGSDSDSTSESRERLSTRSSHLTAPDVRNEYKLRIQYILRGGGGGDEDEFTCNDNSPCPNTRGSSTSSTKSTGLSPRNDDEENQTGFIQQDAMDMTVERSGVHCNSGMPDDAVDEDHGRNVSKPSSRRLFREILIAGHLALKDNENQNTKDEGDDADLDYGIEAVEDERENRFARLMQEKAVSEPVSLSPVDRAQLQQEKRKAMDTFLHGIKSQFGNLSVVEESRRSSHVGSSPIVTFAPDCTSRSITPTVNNPSNGPLSDAVQKSFPLSYPSKSIPKQDPIEEEQLHDSLQSKTEDLHGTTSPVEPELPSKSPDSVDMDRFHEIQERNKHLDLLPCASDPHPTLLRHINVTPRTSPTHTRNSNHSALYGPLRRINLTPLRTPPQRDDLYPCRSLNRLTPRRTPPQPLHPFDRLRFTPRRSPLQQHPLHAFGGLNLSPVSSPLRRFPRTRFDSLPTRDDDAGSSNATSPQKNGSRRRRRPRPPSPYPSSHLHQRRRIRREEGDEEANTLIEEDEGEGDAGQTARAVARVLGYATDDGRLSRSFASRLRGGGRTRKVMRKLKSLFRRNRPRPLPTIEIPGDGQRIIFRDLRHRARSFRGQMADFVAQVGRRSDLNDEMPRPVNPPSTSPTPVSHLPHGVQSAPRPQGLVPTPWASPSLPSQASLGASLLSSRQASPHPRLQSHDNASTMGLAGSSVGDRQDSYQQYRNTCADQSGMPPQREPERRQGSNHRPQPAGEGEERPRTGSSNSSLRSQFQRWRRLNPRVDEDSFGPFLHQNLSNLFPQRSRSSERDAEGGQGGNQGEGALHPTENTRERRPHSRQRSTRRSLNIFVEGPLNIFVAQRHNIERPRAVPGDPEPNSQGGTAGGQVGTAPDPQGGTAGGHLGTEPNSQDDIAVEQVGTTVDGAVDTTGGPNGIQNAVTNGYGPNLEDVTAVWPVVPFVNGVNGVNGHGGGSPNNSPRSSLTPSSSTFPVRSAVNDRRVRFALSVSSINTDEVGGDGQNATQPTSSWSPSSSTSTEMEQERGPLHVVNGDDQDVNNGNGTLRVVNPDPLPVTNGVDPHESPDSSDRENGNSNGGAGPSAFSLLDGAFDDEFTSPVNASVGSPIVELDCAADEAVASPAESVIDDPDDTSISTSVAARSVSEDGQQTDSPPPSHHDIDANPNFEAHQGNVDATSADASARPHRPSDSSIQSYLRVVNWQCQQEDRNRQKKVKPSSVVARGSVRPDGQVIPSISVIPPSSSSDDATTAQSPDLHLLRPKALHFHRSARYGLRPCTQCQVSHVPGPGGVDLRSFRPCKRCRQLIIKGDKPYPWKGHYLRQKSSKKCLHNARSNASAEMADEESESFWCCCIRIRFKIKPDRRGRLRGGGVASGSGSFASDGDYYTAPEGDSDTDESCETLQDDSRSHSDSLVEEYDPPPPLPWYRGGRGSSIASLMTLKSRKKLEKRANTLKQVDRSRTSTLRDVNPDSGVDTDSSASWEDVETIGDVEGLESAPAGVQTPGRTSGMALPTTPFSYQGGEEVLSVRDSFRRLCRRRAFWRAKDGENVVQGGTDDRNLSQRAGVCVPCELDGARELCDGATRCGRCGIYGYECYPWQPQPEPEPEPQSFFDFDSDSEGDKPKRGGKRKVKSTLRRLRRHLSCGLA